MIKRLNKFTLISSVFFAAHLPAHAASLFVYSFNFSDKSYVAVSPFMQWSGAAINDSVQNGKWVAADQFLAIQTDMPYQGSTSWGIQVFTDNGYAGNGSPSSPAFNIPDYFVGSTFHPGGTVNPGLSPRYTGVQSISRYEQPNCTGNTINVLPKSGLISNDPQTPGQGQVRLPMIWRLFDDLPFPAGKVPPITENPPCSSCDFDGTACDWFFFLDKGDETLGSDNLRHTDWRDAYWYVTPMSRDGWLPSVCPNGSCRSRPTVGSDGWTSQYLVVASNFRNATAQVYSTTIFVELFVQ